MTRSPWEFATLTYSDGEWVFRRVEDAMRECPEMLAALLGVEPRYELTEAGRALLDGAK